MNANSEEREKREREKEKLDKLVIEFEKLELESGK
jgi:hypothetical protein